MTIIEMMAEVGENRQVSLPSDCPVGTHRLVIYVDDKSPSDTKELPLGDPALRQKNRVLVLNLPEQAADWLDTDAILEDIRDERRSAG